MTTASSPLTDLFANLFGDTDPRKAGLRRGLCQLTNDQLVKALAVPNVVVDTWNYFDGNFCPLAVGMGLHETMTDPTHEKVLAELTRRGFKVNNTKGIKGNFYTNDRDRDWRLLAHEIILARGKRRLVPVICAFYRPHGPANSQMPQPEPRVLMIQRGQATKFPGQWCIPGGKIEGDESVAECAVREFREETKIDVNIPGKDRWGRLFFHSEVDSDTNPDLRFSVWTVDFTGTPQPPRVTVEESFQGFGWFTPHDCTALTGVMSPAALVAAMPVIRGKNQ